MVVNHRRKLSVCVRLQRTAWVSCPPPPLLHPPPPTPAATHSKETGLPCLPLTTKLPHRPPGPHAHSSTEKHVSTLQAASIGPYFRMKLNWVAGLFDIFQRSWVILSCCTSLFPMANSQNLTSSGYQYPFIPIKLFFPCPNFNVFYPKFHPVLLILIPSLTTFYPKSMNACNFLSCLLGFKTFSSDHLSMSLLIYYVLVLCLPPRSWPLDA